MAQITLSRIGGAIGQRLLPGSFSILGRRISGATLGRLAGRAAEDYFFAQEREGPRLTELHVMESREGVGIPNVYGRMRVAGQLIWAGDFKERRDTERQGKGGPQVTSYSYTVSFAVAVCEGPNAQIERVWSNGEPLSLGAYTHRIYNGSGDQVPDPVIEAHEGVGLAPAYKGLCYIVFEDMPLEDFGNRIPQLSFEVARSPGVAGNKQVADVVQAVNIIPATGEFVYATEPVSVRTFPGRETPLNVNADPNRTDFELSLDQLQQGLPNVTEASLTVAWFGDDLRAEHCKIRPGVETRDRVTVPLSWRVGPTTRANAHLVSQTDEGHAYYGGTPSDDAVVQGIAEMTSRGMAVTLTPFLLMDVPPESALPLPDGSGSQPAFPWRGRISSEHSGTPAIANAVADFLGGAEPSDFSLAGDQVVYSGDPNDWGYRRFILHHAYLSLLAGGVDAFLIGTEMRGATWLNDGQGGFPFVDGLCQLADEVKAILGPACQVSYAADWSEYAAYVPGNGSGDVYFPLDTLWGRTSIDYVGIDWYPPAGDWRDGESHLDWQAGYRSPGEAGYLVANQTGGDGFDWYYASAADRDAQLRTPIIDTAHGEDWVFRVKDLGGWWTSFHHERPAGVRESVPTDWVPGSKPIRLSEIGFPAVDKSTNSPNLFFDPKSSESALPPYSSGERDDVVQAAALSAVLDHWQAQPFIIGAAVWAWDARPFPAFPARTDIWSDGENWLKGHWLNGRTGLSSLTAVLGDLGERAGVAFENGRMDAIVPGYATYGETRLGEAIQPLATAFGLTCSDTGGGLAFSTEALLECARLDEGQFVGRPPVTVRQTSVESPTRLTLLYSSIEDGYEPATADVRAGEGGGPHASVELPLALSAPQAEIVARNLLSQAQIRDGLEVSIPTTLAAEAMALRLEVSGYEGVFRLRDATISESATLEFQRFTDTSPLTPATDVPSIGIGASAPSDPDLLVIDAPLLSGNLNTQSMVVAAFADPWPGQVRVKAGAATDTLLDRLTLEIPALTGVLLEDLQPGPIHRWDRVNEIIVEMATPDLVSVAESGALDLQNLMIVETADGWELLAFASAELIGASQYRLTGLLRQLRTHRAGPGAVAAAGSRCVFIDAAVGYGYLSEEDIGRPLIWAAEPGQEVQEQVFNQEAQRPWTPRLQSWDAGTGALTWMPRGPAISNDWDQPDPTDVGLFDIAWTPHGEAEVMERVSSTSFMVPVSAAQVRLRSVAANGLTGDWVTIPGT